MASAPVAAAAAKLTIPNKAEHIKYRNELHGIYKKLETQIGELAGRRGELETTIQGDITNIKLDNAIGALNAANNEVQAFNTECQITQTEINANNNALRELRDIIKFKIAQAEAAKAAADADAAAAAAQTKAEEAAALQTAKDSLQEYIASLQARIESINDNNLDEFDTQVIDHHTNINQLSAELHNALGSASKSNSEATVNMWKEFDTDANRFINTKRPDFNELKGEFDDKKDKIVTGLNAKIQALQAVAGGAKTAQTSPMHWMPIKRTRLMTKISAKPRGAPPNSLLNLARRRQNLRRERRRLKGR